MMDGHGSMYCHKFRLSVIQIFVNVLLMSVIRCSSSDSMLN
jgi:hypothetical protein